MFKYTVYLTRTDNGETIAKETFDNYDKAVEFAELWHSKTIAYTIVEH